jgi:hypothetical protein
VFALTGAALRQPRFAALREPVRPATLQH